RRRQGRQQGLGSGHGGARDGRPLHPPAGLSLAGAAGMTSGRRRTAREMAVQMLYQSDLGGSALPHIFTTFDLAEYRAREATAPRKKGPMTAAEREEAENIRRRVDEAFEHAKELVRGTLDNQERIDDLIRSQADNWRLERMPAVDRNILRLAIYEMMFEEDTPKLVVLDEAIE